MSSVYQPLRVEGLKKQIGDFVLEADFSIAVGERVGLVGKSGSGKTSLLRIIAGLDPMLSQSESGRIFLGDRELTSLPPQEREIGYVFQDQALLSSLNVIDNITFGLKMRRVPKRERESEGRKWLEKVGMASLAQSPVARLSGGEKQRIAFVRALIWRPQLILLDEPFSALDPDLRKGLRHTLVELHQACPAPLLLVTHDEEDVKALAHRVLSLEPAESWDKGVKNNRLRKIVQKS